MTATELITISGTVIAGVYGFVRLVILSERCKVLEKENDRLKQRNDTLQDAILKLK